MLHISAKHRLSIIETLLTRFLEFSKQFEVGLDIIQVHIQIQSVKYVANISPARKWPSFQGDGTCPTLIVE